jgi:uncharacterized membrane protein (UPF0127 family)
MTRALGCIVWVAVVLITGCEKQASRADSPAVTTDNTPGKAQPRLPTATLWLGSTEMVVEVARTLPQIQTGMMHRKSMEKDEGMLFILPVVQRASFYMKNTLVPLSCAYIDPEGEILEIYDMTPKDENPIFAKSDRILFVLEVNQGWFQRNNIGVGTVIRTDRGSLSETFLGRR